MRKWMIMLLGMAASTLWAAPDGTTIDLSGMWRFQLDPMGFGQTPGSELYLDRLVETIMLPGSTDQGGKGIKNNARYVDRLSRKFEYMGMAWYQREFVIPEEWDGKVVNLKLERCHWETTVYVDGKCVGRDERLSTPNEFDLTAVATPGVHTLTLCVDNRLKYPMDQWTHGTTEYTQTNWNGVVGEMVLEAKEQIHLQQVDVYPDVKEKTVRVKAMLPQLGRAMKGLLELKVRDAAGKTVASRVMEIDSLQTKNAVEMTLGMGKQVNLWDEFTPYLYTLDASLQVDGKTDTKTLRFGMRQVEQGKHHIRLNGRDIHLRGVLDCAVFPITGYPSTSAEDWKRIFRTIRSYGMNHVRFHSWCPPEAAFMAGDELGMYLQVELPMWIKDVGKYPARRDFFEHELYAVLNAYGNHPSFILMCNGNENEGNFDVLEDLVKKGRAYDNRHLYSASTARTHTASDQYYVSHVTSKGGITVYEGVPWTNWDKNKESDIDVPVIAHETGQRCMYPNFAEMSKYTGVLEARNFEVFRERLAKNGMLEQAGDFFRATGAHTVLQYKEVNESLLRSSKSGGFQLLGLADFPGQGSAFVGILDAFWEDKGLVSPEKFRESCAPVVLLARLPKRTFRPEETLDVEFDIYHFGPEALKGKRMSWTLVDEAGHVIQKGVLNQKTVQPSTVDSLGQVSCPLATVTKAGKLTLKAQLGEVKNEWDIWVYPQPADTPANFVYAKAWDESAKAALEAGKNVLLIPEKPKGRKTHFASHFWNPIMFNWDPMIVGTLIDAGHPVFEDFPTASYADWQWWDVLNHATAMELNGLSNLTPVIQSIDTYEYNRKLGIAFEANVGKGKLFVLSVNDLQKTEKLPAMRQLLYSVKKYVGSDRFSPVATLQPYEIDAIFSPFRQQKKTDASGAAVMQLLNR